jgi:tRNA G18 (ribose-2'-O)-methylase SpoU
LSPTCVDPLYRRSVRVSMGEALTLPWRIAAEWPGELLELAARGFELVGLDPSGSPTLVGLADGKVALVLGEEGPGLSVEVRRVLHRCVSIPMRAGPDSLNVAAAAAIAFHHAGGLA